MTKIILIDARMYGLENSGIGRYLIGLINELKKINTENQFVILLRKRYFDSLEFPENWNKVLADFGHYGFKEQLMLPSKIHSIKPDIVHFPHLNVPILWPGKFVVTIHDLTMHHQKTDATTLPLPIYYLKRIPYLLVSKMAVLRSKKIITPTKFVAEDVAKHYNEAKLKTQVIYEGFENLGRIINSQSEVVLKRYSIAKPYFFYVGNAYPHKNLKRAIEAIVQLNKKSSEKVYFVIGGSRGVFTKRLIQLTKDLGASEYVKQIGFVRDEDLPDLNRNSLGFLYPSLTEGFGLQGLEAMSSGTLVICSNIPVFKEIYGDYATYFNPLDYSSIAASMKFVLELDNENRNKLIKASQKFIRKYSWQKMAKETLEVYNKVLQR